MKLRYLWLVLAVTIIGSCKKEKGSSVVTPPAVDSKDNLIKDTALSYARDLYLWNTQIPANFDARAYADPDAIMTAIRAYSKEPGFTDSVDRYSFAAKKADWDNISSGVAQDFGLNIFFRQDGDLRVRLVEPASPAGMAGIKRGWKITAINGNTNINIANETFIVDNIYYSQASTVTFQKPDGSSADISLNASTYQESPVYLDTVYTVGTKKLGYLVFTSFLGDTASVYNRFQQVFSKFNASGVTDVAVDIRYNGGGYVSMSQKLADFLVKSSANGSTMMTEKFNDNYADLNETTKFVKQGPLNISNLFFIVSDNTASASELLVNNLKPYMNVKMIGEATYGKPVGFFPVSVGDWYIFPVSFRSTNSAGVGNYFDGIPVDKEVADGLDKDFGDVTEARLASVLSYVSTGSFGFAPRDNGLSSTLASQVKEANRKLDLKSFKGSVGSARSFLK